MLLRLPMLIAFLAAAGLIAVILALVLAPARVIGVSEETLAASLADSEGSGLGKQICVERSSDRFLCRSEASGGNRAGFRVMVESDGCWTARNLGGNEGRTRNRISDCVELGDYLRFSGE